VKNLGKLIGITTAVLSVSFEARGTSYDDVAVIVNTNSFESVTIGEYFTNARAIPAVNMIYIAVPPDEEIDSTTFDALRTQVENHLTTNNLVNAINYLVTTKGVPLKVNRGNTFSTASPSSSVESELSLILGPYACHIGKAGRMSSPYYYQAVRFSRAQFGIYLVTRLDAFTVGQVLDLIDRSGPQRSVYSLARYVLDQDPNWNSTLPSLNNNMATARSILESRGRVVTLDQSTTYITNMTDVVGYASWGSNDHNANAYTINATPQNTWSPGAIAETYVSTSARSFADPPSYGQSLIADWISEGVSGIKGYVYEPFSSSMAIVQVMFDRYTTGYNLAESFHIASRYLSWMDVIIGDPKTSIDGPESSLPVQLYAFEASYEPSTNRVHLSWSTMTETNNFGFVVQVKDAVAAEFEDIHNSFVPGNGTTLVPQDYSWVHTHPPFGVVQYRLRQIDLDGTVHYSDPITLQTGSPSSVGSSDLPVAFGLMQNYPNPFNPSTVIRYSTPRAGRVVLKVYSELGREIATLVDANQAGGHHEVEFRTTDRDIASGVYFYAVRFEGQTLTKKMILLK
jgi:uncharacterized protein (TIGR03790 family)